MERSMLKVRTRVKDLEPVQQDHSNRDRNHSNAIIVGGWGHSYHQCPSPGGLEWRTLSGAKAPPSPEKGPREE